MRDSDLHGAVGVDAAGSHPVADGHADRDRLACDSRGIQTGLALAHLAVERHAVARTDEHDVALRCVLCRDDRNASVRPDKVYGLRTQVDGIHDLSARAVYGAVLEVFADAVEQHNADRLVERADRPCADSRDSHEEVLVKHLTASDVFDRGQQNMTAEQQIRRNEQNELDGHVRDGETCGKQACADKHFRERMTLFFVLLLLLGCDDLDLALDIRADLADLRQQRIRVFALDAQLPGFIDEYTVVDTVELADLVLHFRRTVCAAEIFERVDTLAVFAVVSGRRCDDLRLALDARADLSDLRQQCIRIFAGHAQLLGLKDKHAVLNAVQFADALLHLRRAVCTADILKRVNALDAVAPCGVLVMMVVMLVVVTAAAVVVIVVVVMMVVVLVVVTAAAVVIIVVMVMLVVVTAAAVIVIIVVMVMMMLVLMLVIAAAVVVIVVVVMMLVLMVVTAAAVVIIVVMVMMMLVLVTAAAVVVIFVMVVMMLVLMIVTAAAVVVIVMMVMMMLVLVRFFYFLCVRSGFFLLLFCHCCRLLIRNNI